MNSERFEMTSEKAAEFMKLKEALSTAAEQPTPMTRAEKRRAEREAKKKQVTYTFTHEQLIEHDKAVQLNYRKRLDEEIYKMVKEEWDIRQKEFNSGCYQDDLMSYLEYTLAIPVKVLVEKFGWKQLWGDRYDTQCKLYKFTKYVLEELEQIGGDENRDIRKEAALILEKYGVGWTTTEREVEVHEGS